MKISKNLRYRKLNILVFICAILIVISTIFVCSKWNSYAEDSTITPSDLKVGDFVQMGTYNDNPLIWRVGFIDEEKGPCLVLNTLLDAKRFSTAHDGFLDPQNWRNEYGSNRWATSLIRRWLNSNEEAGNTNYEHSYYPDSKSPYKNENGFLTNFLPNELNAIATITQKSTISCLEYDLEMYEDDNNQTSLLTLGKNIDEIKGNYDEAYYELVTDKIFLLDVNDLSRIRKNENEGKLPIGTYNLGFTLRKSTWLRTPRAEGSINVNLIWHEGYVTSEAAYTAIISLRPACYLNENNVIFTKGDGLSATNAYRDVSATSTQSHATVITEVPTEIESTNLTMNALLYNADSEILERGFELSLTRDFTNISKVIVTENSDFYSASASEFINDNNLSKGDSFYYRGYVTSKINGTTVATKYGVKLKATLDPIFVAVTNNPGGGNVGVNADETVVMYGRLLNIGDLSNSNIEVGFEYSKSETFENSETIKHTNTINEGETYNCLTPQLEVNTDYYYRAYAKEIGESKVYYSATKKFQISVPEVLYRHSTTNYLTITTVNGLVIDPKGTINTFGFEYSKNYNMSDSQTIETTKKYSDRSFYVMIENLEPFQKYYCRAFAINEMGTGYSEISSFVAGVPDIHPCTNINYNQVTFNGVIFSGDDIAEILEAGFEYTTDNTFQNGIKKIEVVDTTQNLISITTSDVEEAATYYVRTYATYLYNGSNVTVTSQSAVQATIPRNLVMEWPNMSQFSFEKMYDGTDKVMFENSDSYIINLTGFGGAIVPVKITGTYDNNIVGTNKTITLKAELTNSEYKLSGEVEKIVTGGKITKAQINYDVNVQEKVYDGNTKVNVKIENVTGIAEGDNITLPNEVEANFLIANAKNGISIIMPDFNITNPLENYEYKKYDNLIGNILPFEIDEENITLINDLSIKKIEDDSANVNEELEFEYTYLKTGEKVKFIYESAKYMKDNADWNKEGTNLDIYVEGIDLKEEYKNNFAFTKCNKILQGAGEILKKEIKNKVYISKTGQGNVSPLGIIELENNQTTLDLTITLNNNSFAEIYMNNVKIKNVNVSGVVAINDIINNANITIKFNQEVVEKPKDAFKESNVTVGFVSPKNYSGYMQGYSDNTFRPNNYVTREEVAKILASLNDKFNYQTNYLTHIKDENIEDASWSAQYIGFMYMTGIMSGDEKGFKASSGMTRAEFVVALTRSLGIDVANDKNISKNKINDIKGKWYEDYANTLVNKGIISGYPDNTFKGDNFITRAEVCALINRAYNNKTSIIGNNKASVLNKYKDISSKNWFFEDIYLATLK